MKRVVQSKVTAECAFEIMKRILYTVLYRYRNIYIEIMKREVQSRGSRRSVPSRSSSVRSRARSLFLCAFEIMKREEYMRLLEFLSP